MPAGKTYERYPGHNFHYSIGLVIGFPCPCWPCKPGHCAAAPGRWKAAEICSSASPFLLILKHDEFLLLFKQHDESSGTAGTWIWSSWGVEAEVSEEHWWTTCWFRMGALCHKGAIPKWVDPRPCSPRANYTALINFALCWVFFEPAQRNCVRMEDNC